MAGNRPSDETTSADGGAAAEPHSGRAPVEQLLGRVLGGRFEVLEAIGSGAYAITYRGRDLRLDRTVAIKVLHPAFAADASYARRFEREARAAASVAHGNVVDVYDVGQDDGLIYLILQYIEGEDLKRRIAREAPLPPRRAVGIARQILAGLAAIHAAGIIHRDIKPQNVMIGRDGTVRVTDFGIARGAEDTGLTTAGTTVGTASYMAPEQAQGTALGRATDLYAVGVVLFEMLTGRLPFEAPTSMALMLAHVQQPPPRPSSLMPPGSIPPALDEVVLRALAKDPDDRFPDAPAMTAALAAALRAAPDGGELTQAIPVVATRATRSPRRDPVALGAVSRRGTGAPPVDQPSIRYRRPARRRSFALPLALLLLLVIGGGLGGAAIYRAVSDSDDSADDAPEVAAFLTPQPTATATATATVVPVPTETPGPPTETHEPAPTQTPEPEPTETPVPQPTETPVPTATETPEPPPTIVPSASETTIEFAASEWDGAYFQETGNMQPWSAMYARSTGYGTGTLTFTIDGEPAGETFELRVEGMTSENWDELPITVLVNGATVYDDASPFRTWNGVDGEQPWTTATIALPASALRPGDNTIAFVNGVAEGEFSRPPYILLAGGTVTVEVRPAAGDD